MHPRNRYFGQKPDFGELSKSYPAFGAFVRPNPQNILSIDWQDPAAVLELNKTLLLHDFHLTWDMPLDRLCPPVANRANYIHWLEDLLIQQSQAKTPVRGIDIGTGASCIYPLLGCRIADWNFLATEIDPISVSWARKNVDANDLGSFIQVRQVTDKDMLQSVLKPEDEEFDFCMCNPPFFEDEDQAAPSRRTACVGSASEMAVDGGEVGFVKRMIADSTQLQKRVVWYSSMLGRKSSLQAVLACLREYKIHTTRSTTFVQGTTLRWAVAWSFFDVGPPALKDTVLGIKKEARRKNDSSFVIQGIPHIEEVCERATSWLRELPPNFVRWEEPKRDNSETKVVSLSINGSIYAGWRGKKKRKLDDDLESTGTCLLFNFCINITPLNDEGTSFLEGTSASEKEDASKNKWTVTVVFLSGTEAHGEPRHEFWQFVDLLQGEVTRSTRRWRRKLSSKPTEA